jgi:hypothetical protein
MKTTKSNHGAAEGGILSIPAAEEIIEDALSELAYSQDPGMARALRFLAPPGYQAIVELCSENGRSKRRNALADTWSPEEDEVRIYFERLGDEESAPRAARAPRTVHDRAPDEEKETDGEPSSTDIEDRIRDLCAALAEAERGGHAFIALKWFRDSFLPRKAYRWNQNPGVRQMVLAEAIQRGVVLTGKIANPKTAAYPTTTIRLNRPEGDMADESERSQPVAEPIAEGETVSAAIEEEPRGE